MSAELGPDELRRLSRSRAAALAAPVVMAAVSVVILAASVVRGSGYGAAELAFLVDSAAGTLVSAWCAGSLHPVPGRRLWVAAGHLLIAPAIYVIAVVGLTLVVAEFMILYSAVTVR